MKQINYKNSSFIIFITISILYAVGNFIWWYLNTPAVPTGSSALYFSYILSDGFLYYAAPLSIWVMKIMFFLFGKHYFDLQIVIMNYVFFLIALYFIYKIGLELKNKENGNIAMILFALTPAIYVMSREYGHQDWHIMIAMTVNIYCLIKLNNFKNRKWSILYGITVGLGLLIKDAFLMFFFAPWLYAVLKSLIEKIEKNKIINIIITIVIGSLISYCHYFRADIIYKVLHEPILETTEASYIENIKIMTIGLSEYLLSPPIFILLIISLIWFIFKYKGKNKLILLLWYIAPWITIIVMPTKTLPEYGTGFIPAIILIISTYISNINKKILRKILTLLIIAVCMLQFLLFSYIKEDIKAENLPLCYFSNIVYTDRMGSSTIETIKYLNKYYGNDTIYMEINVDIDMLELKLLMTLNDFNRKIGDLFEVQTFYDKENKIDFIEDKSISILAKNTDDLGIAEYIYQFSKESFNKSPEYKDKKIQEILNIIEKRKKYIKDNFYFVEEIYWQNIKDEEHLTKIYKKKY